jgi:aldehyde dehydrogenase (NAD+)
MSATSLIQKTVLDQKTFFKTGETRSLVFRFEQLRKLRCMIEENESDIMTALSKDMGKPQVEAFTSEIGMLLEEIKYTEKHLKGWIKPKTCKTMVFHMPARSYSIPEPYGVVCIIGPWNYPFQLLISPLIGALAAGNCAILKPSELSKHSSSLIETLIRKYFEPSSVAVITGGAEISSELLKQKIDYIFFTGSSQIGKKVLNIAAQNLIPCTLELGGKNPCIVDSDKNIQQTAKRIAWGKFFNAGQTCVAPDYVIVRNEIKEILTEELKAAVESFYHKNRQEYARIINKQHFDRIISLFEEGSIVHGG